MSDDTKWTKASDELAVHIVCKDLSALGEIAEVCGRYHRGVPNSVYIDYSQSLSSYRSEREAAHPDLTRVTVVGEGVMGKIRDALEAALPMIHRQFQHTRCAVTEALALLPSATVKE
jgi:hypothetical protein